MKLRKRKSLAVVEAEIWAKIHKEEEEERKRREEAKIQKEVDRKREEARMKEMKSGDY